MQLTVSKSDFEFKGPMGSIFQNLFLRAHQILNLRASPSIREAILTPIFESQYFFIKRNRKDDDEEMKTINDRQRQRQRHHKNI